MDPDLGFVDCRWRVGDPPLPDGTFQLAWRPAPLRRIIEGEIERLIALLDTIDGDCDVEENGDEGDYSW